MQKRKRTKNLTPKDFTLIKTLCDQQVKHRLIAEITGRSDATIDRIVVANTFAEYQKNLKEYNAATKARREQRQGIIIPTTQYTGIEPPKDEQTDEQKDVSSDELIKVLWMIEAQLRRLADAWEKKPTQSLKERILG